MEALLLTIGIPVLLVGGTLFTIYLVDKLADFLDRKRRGMTPTPAPESKFPTPDEVAKALPEPPEGTFWRIAKLTAEEIRDHDLYPTLYPAADGRLCLQRIDGEGRLGSRKLYSPTTTKTIRKYAQAIIEERQRKLDRDAFVGDYLK